MKNEPYITTSQDNSLILYEILKILKMISKIVKTLWRNRSVNITKLISNMKI
jgi:hypothetical protein